MCCITYYIRPDVVACGCIMRWAWRCVVFMPALVFLILYKVICACVLRYVLRYTSSVFVTRTVLYYDISRKVLCRVRQFVAAYLVERWMGDRGGEYSISHELLHEALCGISVYLMSYTVVRLAIV